MAQHQRGASLRTLATRDEQPPSGRVTLLLILNILWSRVLDNLERTLLSLQALSVRVVAGPAIMGLSYTRGNGIRWMIFSARNERRKSKQRVESRLINRTLTTQAKSKSLTRTTRKRARKRKTAKIKSSLKSLIMHQVPDVGVHYGSCRRRTFPTMT